jgi:hypothetical protein
MATITISKSLHIMLMAIRFTLQLPASQCQWLQLQIQNLPQAAEAVAAEHQSKQLSTSRLLILLTPQRFMQSLSALKFTHAHCFHNLWEQDVQVQMAVSTSL